MDDNGILVHLPPDYDENALHLLVQGPRVLYAYWELSTGLKDLLREKSNALIRLNIEGQGVFCMAGLDMHRKSLYFRDVEPGRTYNSEIGIMDKEKVFYPLLRSNSVNTPLDRPYENDPLLEKQHGSILPASSWCLPKGDS